MPAIEAPAALRAWVSSIPVARCAAPAFRLWTGAPDSTAFTVTKTTRFGEGGTFSGAILGLTIVGKGADEFSYALGRFPHARAIAMHAGSEPDETTFTAAVADAPQPPHAVAQLETPLVTHDGLGIGSSRAAVEAALGPSHATSRCGDAIVRYEPAMPAISIAEMWFVYRNDRVIAFARYEAV